MSDKQPAKQSMILAALAMAGAGKAAENTAATLEKFTPPDWFEEGPRRAIGAPYVPRRRNGTVIESTLLRPRASRSCYRPHRGQNEQLRRPVGERAAFRRMADRLALVGGVA